MIDLRVGFGWLVTYAAHSTLLLGLTGLFLHRRKSHPAVRDVLWKAALIGGLGTASIQTMGWRPLGGSYPVAPRSAVRTKSVARVAPISAGARPDQDPSGPPARPLVLETPGPIEPAASGVAVPTSWPSLLVEVWALLAAGLLVGHLVLRRRLARRLAGRIPLESGPLFELMAGLAREAGVTRSVRITVSDRLASPIAFGWREICVPSVALTDLTGAQQRSMLAHELAHLVRLDAFWLAASTVLERVFFFQPLNRLARVGIQQSAELLCDEWAARRTGSALTMAHCLVKVAEWIEASPAPVPVAGMAEERSQLVDRVRRLVEEHDMSKKPGSRWLPLAAIAAVVITALVAPKVTLVGQDPRKSTSVKAPSEPAVAATLADAKPEAEWLSRSLAAGPPRGVLGGVVADVKDPSDRVQYPDTDGTVAAALVAALKDPHPEVRRAAAQALGNRGDHRATAGLVEALRDTDRPVRVAAAEALASLGDPAAIGGLTAASRDQSTEVRHAAIEALAHFDHEQVTADPFLPALRDSNPEIKATAARALADRKDRRATPQLIEMLKDSNRELRQIAIQALTNLGDRSSIDAIAGLIKDPSADVRQTALESVAEFEVKPLPAAALDALRDENPSVREAAARAAARSGDRRAVPVLKELLTDTRADVRAVAVEALAEIRDESAIDALVLALKSKDPVVRKAAAEALGQR